MKNDQKSNITADTSSHSLKLETFRNVSFKQLPSSSRIQSRFHGGASVKFRSNLESDLISMGSRSADSVVLSPASRCILET